MDNDPGQVAGQDQWTAVLRDEGEGLARFHRALVEGGMGRPLAGLVTVIRAWWLYVDG